jgi:hypothetical protein
MITESKLGKPLIMKIKFKQRQSTIPQKYLSPKSNAPNVY